MRQLLLLLVAGSLVTLTGCGAPTPGVNKGKDMPVPPDNSGAKKDTPAKKSK